MRPVLMFDYDGVIVDSLDYFLDSFLEACHEHGFHQMDGREAFLTIFDTNMYTGMVAAGIPEDQVYPVLISMGKKLEGRNRNGLFFPLMADTMNQLAQSCRVIVITSNLTPIVAESLHVNGVHCAEAVLGSDIEPSKVKKIRSVIGDANESPCYYIGDTVGDMVEGREGGAKTVAVAWGWHSAERLRTAAPDHMVHSPEELAALFRPIAALPPT
ncbi:MAG TPA: HAD hydrolase-like protein [Candidatus Hydrogenedentes bacterium]|nr:HAD hydrolase-like protein [Candidatus Hydrogenedentota bacterium]